MLTEVSSSSIAVSPDVFSGELARCGPKVSRLGNLLVGGNFITPEQLDDAFNYQVSKGGRLGSCLIRLGYITEDVLHSVLSLQFGVGMIDLSCCEIDASVLKLLPRELVVRHQVLPVRRTGTVLSVKIMSRMNIAEKRVPQDGRVRIRTTVGDKPKELDFRVSVLPTLFGEKIVLRLLDKENLMFDMMRLGFEAESLKKFERAIHKPFGMVLVTGPTGSGKTNTLYSAISQLNKPDTNIMTAEDPVEFNLLGINQVLINGQVGLTT